MDFFFTPAFAQSNNIITDTQTQSNDGIAEFFAEFLLAIPHWIAAGVVFFLAMIVGKIIKKYVNHQITKQSRYSIQPEASILIERFVYFFILTLGAIISFKLVGIDIANIIGFLSLGIGFAFKDLLANFIAGVVILTQHKFKIGDVIKMNGQMGTVKEIEARTTQVETFDGVELIIPNSEMLTSVIENLSAREFRRFSFEVGVHYDTPLDKALQITQNTLKAHSEVVPEPAPIVMVSEFADSAITLTIRFWVEMSASKWWKVQSEIMQNLKNAYDQAGIGIPYPIRTLTLDPYDAKLSKALNLPAPPCDDRVPAPATPEAPASSPVTAPSPEL